MREKYGSINNAFKNIFTFMILLGIFSFSTFAATGTTSSTDSISAISVSLVSVNPDPAAAGSTAEIRLSLFNNGGKTVNDLMVAVEPTYPFEEVSGSNLVQSVGTIQGYQGQNDNNQQIVKFTLKVNKDAVAGSYELKVKYYVNGSNSFTYKSVYIDVGSKESVEISKISNTQLDPGRETPVTFTIRNVGSAPLKDLTFYWENSAGVILPVGSDNTKHIKFLDIGESTDLEYTIIADSSVTAGLYKLDLYLSYYDSLSNTQKQVTTTAGMYVGGETDFDVALSDVSSGVTSFSIANIGSNPATSVSVTIPEQRGWSVSGTNSVIIGNLNKGDYTVASFKLSASSTSSSGFTGNRNMTRPSGTGTPNANAQQSTSAASGMYRRNLTSTASNLVKMTIAYTDTTGTRKVVEKEVKGSISSSTSGNMSAAFATGTRRTVQKENPLSTYKWYIVGTLLVVAGFVVYSRYKKKKMMDPDTKLTDIFAKNTDKRIEKRK